MTPLALTVNDRAVDAVVEPRTNLADFVRDKLDLTGTHLGCEPVSYTHLDVYKRQVLHRAVAEAAA